MHGMGRHALGLQPPALPRTGTRRAAQLHARIVREKEWVGKHIGCRDGSGKGWRGLLLH